MRASHRDSSVLVMKWILDDGPLGVLAQYFDPGWTWPEGSLFVVREVADSATNDKSGRRQALLAMCSPSGLPSITVHDGGPDAASMLWGHLRPQSATAVRDLGEDVSVAVCATELLDATFVTMDKRAAYVALAELGRSRVTAPFELWDWLERNGHLSITTFRELCTLTAKKDQGLSGVPMCHRR